MFTRVCLSLALLAAMPAWPQVDTNATGAGMNTADQTQMLTPPPVSGEAYPTAVGSDNTVELSAHRMGHQYRIQ